MSDTKKHRPFVEVNLVGNVSGGNVIYRFFGFGEWDVNYGRGFEPINGIYVPAEALKIAAAYRACRSSGRAFMRKDW